VKNLFVARNFLALLAASSIALAGCATRPAPDIKGRWKAVNHYAETTEAIPLYQSYVFYPYPMDGTLKTMLTRWAKDSRMTLSYLHPSDFTLYAPVAQVYTSNLQEAVSRLSAIYAEQRVSITATGNQIVVRTWDAPKTGAVSEDPASATH
jgi:hypothetical protein